MHLYFYTTIAVPLHLCSPVARCSLWTSWQVWKQTTSTAQVLFEANDGTSFHETRNAHYKVSDSQRLGFTMHGEVPVAPLLISSAFFLQTNQTAFSYLCSPAALGSSQLGIICPGMGGNRNFACLPKLFLFLCPSHSVMKTSLSWLLSLGPCEFRPRHRGLCMQLFPREGSDQNEVSLSCFQWQVRTVLSGTAEVNMLRTSPLSPGLPLTLPPHFNIQNRF